MNGKDWHHTVGVVLATARASLAAREIPEPALEASVLLASLLGRSRAWLVAHADAGVSKPGSACFLAMVERRCRREPTAYILGQKQWLDITLEVNRSVLIPRPETELLAEEAIAALSDLQRSLARPAIAVDVGTGSGALAIAMARAVPGARVLAIDNSAGALRVARTNARRLGALTVQFLLGNFLAPVTIKPDIVVANMPYVPTCEVDTLEPELTYEPVRALDGGPDGLDLIRELLHQAKHSLAAHGRLMFEGGAGQSHAIALALRGHWPDAQIRIRQDYAGFDRIVVAKTE